MLLYALKKIFGTVDFLFSLIQSVSPDDNRFFPSSIVTSEYWLNYYDNI